MVGPSAGRARTPLAIEPSSAYERLLIAIDAVHGDASPALLYEHTPGDEAALCAIAARHVETLAELGLDELLSTVLLAMLDDAHALDHD